MTPLPQKDHPERITATAIGYQPDVDSAPVVLASGRGKIAEQILEIARVNQIPIHEDELLAETLSQISINDVIPPELYHVVAQIFAYIYRVQKDYSNRLGS
jgi:flagellar biosynthesis protein